MTETLQEFFDSRGVNVRVDRKAGVIRGVKILGMKSRNGRTYLPEALSQAARLYEDAKVNVNHPRGNPSGPRNYQDRIGVIRNVSARPGEGLFADFHFNPKHGLAEQLVWDAEHAPQNVGFSHNVQARTARRGDQLVVEAITKVQSVDLVADPATTHGLFESSGEKGEADPRATPSVMTVDDLKRDYPELIEELRREQAAELDTLRGEVQRLQLREAMHQRRTVVRRLLREFHLPDPETGDPQDKLIISDRFFESLLAAEDKQEMRALIEERAGLVRCLGGMERAPALARRRPLSRDQHFVDSPVPLDTKTFVEAIT